MNVRKISLGHKSFGKFVLIVKLKKSLGFTALMYILWSQQLMGKGKLQIHQKLYDMICQKTELIDPQKPFFLPPSLSCGTFCLFFIPTFFLEKSQKNDALFKV